jgi:hypothetical protein
MDEAASMATATARRGGLFSDIWTFFLSRPATPTLVDFPTLREREDYGHRIMQRIGVNVSEYGVLNIHRVGIDAPVSYVFEEAQNWGEGLSSWPNWVATLEPVDADPAYIEVRLLGGLRRTQRFMKRLFGPRFGRLFRLTARKRQDIPDPANFDNARYLFFECSGGYPIGIMAVYVRSPIAPLGETKPTQFFLVVGFDFYGRKNWPRSGIINRIWGTIHNRVTGNVLNEFKRSCEARCRRRLEGVLNDQSAGG